MFVPEADPSVVKLSSLPSFVGDQMQQVLPKEVVDTINQRILTGQNIPFEELLIKYLENTKTIKDFDTIIAAAE